MEKLKTAKKRIFAVALCAALSITMTMPSFAAREADASETGEELASVSSNETAGYTPEDDPKLTQEELEGIAGDENFVINDENGNPVDISDLLNGEPDDEPEAGQEIVISENDPVVDVTAEDIREEKTDALSETYIKKNLNPEYAEYKQMELVDVLYGKQALFDMTQMKEGDTPESILHALEFGTDEEADEAIEKYITQLSAPIAVYDVDEESDYYAAFADTLFDTENVVYLDSVFAKCNELGEEVEGMFFDEDTGIAYIPKNLFGDELMEYQIQIMHGIGGYDLTTDIDSVSNGTNSDVYTTVSELIDTETYVQATEGLDEENLSVALNGIPISDEFYEYDSLTGVLHLSAAPGAVQTVSVSENTNEAGKTAKNIFAPITAKAATTFDSMNFYKTAKATIPASVKELDLFKGNIRVLYSDAPQIHTGTELDAKKGSGIYNYGSLKTLISDVTYGYQLDPDYLKERIYDLGQFDFYVDLKGNTLKRTTKPYISGSFMSDWGKFIAECAHAKSSILNKQSSIPRTDVWYNIKSLVRVFKINRTAKKPYAIIGIVTSNSNTQAGVGLYKLHIESEPDIKTINASKTTTFEEKVTLTANKKDSATKANLPGATIRFYLNSISGSGVATVTTDANGNAVYQYTRKSKNISKTSKTYKYVANWKQLTATQQKALTKKGYYQSKKAALAAANAEVSNYIDSKKAAFFAKSYTWYAVETQAPPNHRLATTNNIRGTEAANSSTVSFSFVNDEPTGSIKIIKTNESGNNNIISKDENVTYDGAVYGVYAAQTILKSDNKTQAYATNQLVKTVTISNHKDGHYGVASGLMPGVYYVKEISNPYGFMVNGAKSANISVVANRTSTSSVINQMVTNMTETEITRDLEIEKYKTNADGSNGEPEGGATFVIKDKNGNMLYSNAAGKATYDRAQTVSTAYTLITGTSGSNLGKASLKSIPIGQYTIEQTGGEDNYEFISPQNFEVKNDASDLSAIKYTFNNISEEQNPRLAILKSARIYDASAGIDVQEQENGIIFDVYTDFDPETGTGNLVDVIVTGAISNRGGEDPMSVITGSDITTAHAQAKNYAAWIISGTGTEPAGVYTKGNNGQAVSRIIDPDTKYTLVQVNQSNGYRKVDPFSVTLPEDAAGYYGSKDNDKNPLVHYNEFEGEKITIDKKRTDIKGAEYKEAGAEFVVFDIAKVKALEQRPDYDADTFGYFPYTEYFKEARELDTESIYRQNLMLYLQEHECVMGVMTTDDNGHAEMVITPNSYLYQYDNNVSAEDKGPALLQTIGYSSVGMQPVLTAKDAYDGSSEADSEYEYTASAKTYGSVTNLRYDMTDKPNHVGYVVLNKYMTTGVNKNGKQVTVPEGNAVFQILNADTGAFVQTLPKTNVQKGYTKSQALPYGKYILRQTDGDPTHKLSEDMLIEISKATIDENKIYMPETEKAADAVTVRHTFNLSEFFDEKEAGEGKSGLNVSFIYDMTEDETSQSASNDVKTVNVMSNPGSAYDEGYEAVLRKNGKTYNGSAVTKVVFRHKKDTNMSGENWVVDLYNGNTVLRSGIPLPNVSGDTGTIYYASKIELINEENDIELRLTKVTKNEINKHGNEVEDHLLNDAQFNLVDASTGKTIANMTTGVDADGQYKASLKGKASEMVKYGNYKLVEISKPEGYSAEEVSFSIDAYSVRYTLGGDAYYEVTVEDEPIYGHVSGVKMGDSLNGRINDQSGTGFRFDDIAVPGAEYGLYAKEDIVSPDGEITYHSAGDLVSKATTDIDGSLTFKRTLPDGTTTENFYLGEYYVQEISSPDGYVLDTEQYDVSLIMTNADAFNDAEEVPLSEYEINEDNQYAYAVLDEDGTLTFFRSPIDYTNYVDEYAEEGTAPVNCDGMTSDELGYNFVDVNGIMHFGKLYCNIESLPAGSAAPWAGDAADILNVEVAYEQVIRPSTMAGWFKNCRNMETCDLSHFDTTNVTDMSGVFMGCRNMTELVHDFNTSNVTDMRNMFNGCSSIKFLDMTGVDNTNVTNADFMFVNNTDLRYIYVSDVWMDINQGSSNIEFVTCQ